MSHVVIGIAQARSVPLDLDASVDTACSWIAEAGRSGVQLLAFPEAWLPGYPFWCDDGAFAHWGNAQSRRLHARFVDSSLVVGSPASDRLRAAAREAHVAVVIGANEREPNGGSVYNSLLSIDEHGDILAVRRKLVPTFGERLIWCTGDAAGLEAYPLGGARVGGMICWEHWMPVVRHVLHGSGEEIHVAAWPHGRELHQLASRHYAFEGRVFVLAAAALMGRDDLPKDFPLQPQSGAWPAEILGGGSAILSPDGSYVVEPVLGLEKLLIAEVDLARTREERLTLDVAGHYARSDLFDVRVRRERLVAMRDE
jgi:predicted amidohydrolase